MFTLSVSGSPVELRVVRFTGSEALSGGFEFRLELCGPEVELATLLGKEALLTIESVDTPRHVHGILAELEYIGESRQHCLYTALLVPRTWKLHHRSDSRIFQRKTTQSIVTEVLTKAGISGNQFRFALTGSYSPRDYCVQYRETDHDFVSRLLEEDGIAYHFEHSTDNHALVFSDSGNSPPIPGDAEIWFNPPQGEVFDREHVMHVRVGEVIRTDKVSLRDFNLHRPDLPMEASATVPPDRNLEAYDFPGEYQDNSGGGNAPDRGPTLAKTRLDAIQTARRLTLGHSDSPRLTAGHRFTLEGHPRANVDGELRLLKITHRGEQPQALDQDAGDKSFEYYNDFVAMPQKQPYRPPRVTPRPAVRGVQTATVTGPPGEEIHVDEWGRVKIQFHWDRIDGFDDDSSCWVRVSQLWAGNNWGAMFIPRVGHEVIVDFIEGDPDRPIITGRIYHGNNPVPYPLPNHKTKSTIKSDTYQGGGYNEFRYEDQKGAEQIFMHAQRNLDIRVLNDRMETILHDRHLTVGQFDAGAKVGDFHEMVMRDRTIQIHRNHHEHIGGDLRIRVGGVDGVGHTDRTNEGNQREHILQSSHLTVDQNLHLKIGKDEHHHVVGNAHRKVDGRQALEVTGELHLRASTIVVEASRGLTIKGPGGFVTIDPSGVIVQGTLVRINSGGSALSGAGTQAVDPDPPLVVEPVNPKPADNGGY
ncbi:MAG: type VI secretion system tip protein VgrG [Myxococcales bacterium]|nr:type VI secretion system tip protein VgrG [Myxococcales bacterium]